MRMILMLTLAGSLFAQTKKPDVCTPPASRVAPSLPAKMLDGQGTEYIKFPITTQSAEAQKFFQQGVAQMHSFWAVESERSFLQAAALDPEAPMPWWGVAMVAMGDFRPRFQLENYGMAVPKVDPRVADAVRKARELSAVPGKATDLEKLYIESIAARRDPLSNNQDGGYIKGLRAIAAKYPDEVEAKSYLALHLMRGFETPSKAARDGSEEAVTILRALLESHPDHPGAHHYVIHGWEGSTFASDAWASCKRYAELAPNIPHALHMPGHIYAQTGRWQDAAKSFSDAAANELKWIKADSLYTTGHHGHNVQFLVTSESFQGNAVKAKESAQHLLDFGENPREKAAIDNNRTAYRQGWFGMMRALVQNERWDEILDGKTLPTVDKPREAAWRQWAMGMAFVAKKAAKPARAALDAMDEAIDQYQDKVKQAAPAELRVARQELAALLPLANHKAKKNGTTDAIEKLWKVSARERALIYSEPPFYPRPVTEVIGKLALEAGRLDVAEKAYKEALVQYPASAKATAGLKEIARRQATGAGGN